jgi:serine/threonine protein phosphatase 1
MQMGRKLVLGDVHGAWRALKQCFDRAGFDYDQDQLIALGDICDGWPETRQCMDEILKVKNLVYILGNHDTWFNDWLKTGEIADIWYVQGGKETIESYKGKKVPEAHRQFFEKAVSYHQIGNELFVHAGFDPTLKLEFQNDDTFLWDRSLANAALNAHAFKSGAPLTSFDCVYVGHTPIRGKVPINAGGVWLMDTGAGWDGVLSLMDIETKQVFTSDPVPQLYPGIQGRRKH